MIDAASFAGAVDVKMANFQDVGWVNDNFKFGTVPLAERRHPLLACAFSMDEVKKEIRQREREVR